MPTTRRTLSLGEPIPDFQEHFWCLFVPISFSMMAVGYHCLCGGGGENELVSSSSNHLLCHLGLHSSFYFPSPCQAPHHKEALKQGPRCGPQFLPLTPGPARKLGSRTLFHSFLFQVHCTEKSPPLCPSRPVLGGLHHLETAEELCKGNPNPPQSCLLPHSPCSRPQPMPLPLLPALGAPL